MDFPQAMSQCHIPGGTISWAELWIFYQRPDTLLWWCCRIDVNYLLFPEAQTQSVFFYHCNTRGFCILTADVLTRCVRVFSSSLLPWRLYQPTLSILLRSGLSDVQATLICPMVGSRTPCRSCWCSVSAGLLLSPALAPGGQKQNRISITLW